MDDPRCESCAACCLSAVVPPFGTEEINDIPEDLAAPIRAVWDHAANPDTRFWDQTGRRECSWLDIDTGKCRHYTLRPKECRDFEVGGSDCLGMRTKAGIDRGTTNLTIEGSSYA